MTGRLAVDVSAVQERSAKEVPIVTSSALMNISDPVPAITEAGATGEIAAIFADIRLVLGVDVVNLIWRHLATIPGALPWAWGTLRPLYADGSIAAEAAALHGDLDLPRLPSFPAEAFAAAGLLKGDISAIRDILAAYDRTNAMALVALSALAASIGGRAARSRCGFLAPHRCAARIASFDPAAVAAQHSRAIADDR